MFEANLLLVMPSLILPSFLLACLLGIIIVIVVAIDRWNNDFFCSLGHITVGGCGRGQ